MPKRDSGKPWAQVYKDNIPTKKSVTSWAGPYAIFEIDNGWCIETPMNAIILDRLTYEEAYTLAYALNKTFPVKSK